LLSGACHARCEDPLRVAGVAAAQRATLEARLHERLNALVVRHELDWD
jgi:hypothetical protein